MILKNTVPNNILWFNKFHVSTKNRVPEFGNATVKYSSEIWKF